MYCRAFMFYMTHYVYILKSRSVNKYYIGSSENPDKRLRYHNIIEKGFTSRYRPWKIVFKNKFESKTEAQTAERKIKSWKSRKYN